MGILWPPAGIGIAIGIGIENLGNDCCWNL